LNPGFVRRLVAEFAIIFVGVVLAFQFENWRESRQDREREGEALQALAEDFRVNRDRLSETRRSQSMTVQALGVWLRAAAGKDPVASADSLGVFWPYAISWYGEETLSGAYDGLTSSGDLGLLRDARLRSLLSEFYGVVDAGFEDHDNEMDLLMALIDLSREESGRIVAPEGDLDRLGKLVDPRDVESIRSDPGLHGLLAWKMLMARNRLNRLDWLMDRADTIAALLPQPLQASRADL